MFADLFRHSKEMTDEGVRFELVEGAAIKRTHALQFQLRLPPQPEEEKRREDYV
jgi:hypothetical protein